MEKIIRNDGGLRLESRAVRQSYGMPNSTRDPVAHHLEVTRRVVSGRAIVVAVSAARVSNGVVVENYSVHVLEVRRARVNVGDGIACEHCTRRIRRAVADVKNTVGTSRDRVVDEPDVGRQGRSRYNGASLLAVRSRRRQIDPQVFERQIISAVLYVNRPIKISARGRLEGYVPDGDMGRIRKPYYIIARCVGGC